MLQSSIIYVVTEHICTKTADSHLHTTIHIFFLLFCWILNCTYSLQGGGGMMGGPMGAMAGMNPRLMSQLGMRFPPGGDRPGGAGGRLPLPPGAGVRFPGSYFM